MGAILTSFVGCSSTFLLEYLLRNCELDFDQTVQVDHSLLVSDKILENFLCFVVLCVLCCSMRLFLYKPFCHGALNLDLSST